MIQSNTIQNFNGFTIVLMKSLPNTPKNKESWWKVTEPKALGEFPTFGLATKAVIKYRNG
jgi:hypothetical protein